MKNLPIQPLRSQPFTRAGLVSMAAALIFFGASSRLQAQSDDFDSGSLANWNVVPYPGAPTVSFPTVGAGKGLRVQCPTGGLAFFVPKTSPAYTDFYVSVDIVVWGNSLDQALVLMGRAQNIQTILGTTGYVCNYDAQQDGAGPGDRSGGQFQINRIDNLQAIVTIAAADISLEPDRPYRLVFKGVGIHFTAQIYDYYDLTKPVVTLEAEDGTYPTGVCGMLSYSRDSGGVTDVTFDNYYAAASDPDTSIAPAIAHPLVGTPQVMTRTPAKRFTNFHPPASGIAFTAKTLGTNLINAAATKLYLNGLDVSSALAPLPVNGTNVSFTTAAGTLQANKVYSARIELQDVGGALKSANTFGFDTFSDAYLTNEPVKTVEAEDYNYWDFVSGKDGAFLLDPIIVSGKDINGVEQNSGVGYYFQQGMEGIDYHYSRTSPEGGWAEYRYSGALGSDSIGITQGGKEEIEDLNYPLAVAPPDRPNDNQRQKYKALNIPEYQVVHTEPGEWFNYARKFAATNYNVYLRVGCFSPTQAQLDMVGGDTSSTNQTTAPLGMFDIPNNLMRINYIYVPLTCSGVPVVAGLGGTNTVRLTMAGTPTKDNRVVSLNYLMFVPTASLPIALMSSANVAGPYTEDSSAVINMATKTITLPQSGGARFYRIRQCPPAPNITSIKRVGGNLVMTYN